MFNIFKRTNKPSKPAAEESYEEAVILEIPLESGEELGSDDEHKEVFKLEEELEKLVGNNEVVDGHEFGEGTAILYLYGPAADRLFEKVTDRLKASAFNRFEVTLRYGLAEDPESKEKHFTLAWD